MKYYYLTFNDVSSGVYNGQVIDVVRLYNSENIEIRLVAFLSLRNYWTNRKIIKSYLPNSIILPSFPKLNNWKLNKWILSLFIHGKNNMVIARSVFATNLCLELRGKFLKIIYDGRGAIAAEQDEYGVYNGTGVEKDISKLERKAVIESDFRISVSEKLVEYWIKNYNYCRGQELIMPCSVNPSFKMDLNDKNYELFPGLKKDDVLLIYSGSLAGWQSFKILSEILKKFLNENSNVKILFLSKEQEEIARLVEEFPNTIYRKWVKPEEVKDYLLLGDYGLLIREKNITNHVASPVKFAEYLMSGLTVIMTPDIGDYSELIQSQKNGLIIDDKMDYKLTKVTQTQKQYNQDLANSYLSKSSRQIVSNYKMVLL